MRNEHIVIGRTYVTGNGYFTVQSSERKKLNPASNSIVVFNGVKIYEAGGEIIRKEGELVVSHLYEEAPEGWLKELQEEARKRKAKKEFENAFRERFGFQVSGHHGSSVEQLELMSDEPSGQVTGCTWHLGGIPFGPRCEAPTETDSTLCRWHEACYEAEKLSDAHVGPHPPPAASLSQSILNLALDRFLGPENPSGQPTGAEMIVLERRRQIEVEGYTTEHDDEHADWSLTRAARCYAEAAYGVAGVKEWNTTTGPEWLRRTHASGAWPDEKLQEGLATMEAEAADPVLGWCGRTDSGAPKPISDWPWESEAWNPSSDPIRNLVKAGALIAAEIDRLQRQQSE